MPGRGFHCNCHSPLPVADAVAQVEGVAADGPDATIDFGIALAPFVVTVALGLGPSAAHAGYDTPAAFASTAAHAVYDVPAVFVSNAVDGVAAVNAPSAPIAHATSVGLAPVDVFAVLAIVAHALLAVHGDCCVAVIAATAALASDTTTRWHRSWFG